MVTMRGVVFFSLICLVLIFSINPALGEKPGAEIKAIQVKLKVQSITKENFYMGDVWVAPPKFSDAQAGKTYIGYARAFGLDELGSTIDLSPVWEPGDPAMLEVSPKQGHEVKLTVLKAGQSYLTVTAGGISKKMAIKASSEGAVMNVEISPSP